MLKDKLHLNNIDDTSGANVALMVILAHVALALVVGVVILLLGGVIRYLPWILLGGAVLVGGSAWFFLHRLKQQGAELAEMLNHPTVRGRAFEVKLLGGVASLRVGPPVPGGNEAPAIGAGSQAAAPRLEDAEAVRRRELEQLAQLRREELISQEEYDELKARLLNR